LVSRDITERDRAEKENFRLAIQLQRTGDSGNLGLMAATIANELGPLLDAVRDKVRFAADAARQLQPLLRASKEMLAAATSNKLTPELLARATAADRATDVDYLAAEVPNALAECHAKIERVRRAGTRERDLLVIHAAAQIQRVAGLQLPCRVRE
jgi:cell division septum initiation protein DivIVA